jgi:tetratricopeptide (TPR) repeat protein
VYCTLVVGIFLLQARTAEAEPLAREMALRHPGVRGWSARVAAIDGTLGRLEPARRCLAEIMARGLAWVRQEPFALSGLCSVADLCAVAPDVDAAKDLYRAMLPYADHVGITHLAAVSHGPITRHLGILAELQGDVVLAEQHYRRALEHSAALSSPTYLALTGAAYAQLLLRAGGTTRRADAAYLLQDALKHAERSELHVVSEFLRSLARRHDVRPRAGASARRPAALDV